MPGGSYRFEVEGAAGKIECQALDPGAGRRGIAIVAHPHPLFGGTMDNKVVHTLAKAFHELGYLAVRFNFRGVGKSEGAHDEGIGEAEDVLELYDFLEQQFGKLPLILAGFSFGGFVMARVSLLLDPARLVLVSPAVSRFEVPQVQAGTIVLQGEQDEVIPLRDMLDWARPQALPVIVFPGAGHFFHGRLNQLKQTIIASCKD